MLKLKLVTILAQRMGGWTKTKSMLISTQVEVIVWSGAWQKHWKQTRYKINKKIYPTYHITEWIQKYKKKSY